MRAGYAKRGVKSGICARILWGPGGLFAVLCLKKMNFLV